ncbi:acylphosphatase-2 isoform X2 [Alligator mississippiensis]|uniref:Acylphosphatase n=1 Tax=Alligator mississippiensis TaxID=8496 RepID=A0A151PFS8_ALLMI|nr:acylphosphatase-2 isoform X2 [Alligator mississippiensis]KYO47858.1 acylphosphatase-1 [Alligator mississippiensis]
MAAPGLWAFDYEIYGDVQGVFFRKYTEEQGRKLGLAGWVRNTPRGTVTGQVQGPKDKVEIMRNWLRSVGSPMSRIDRAVFSNEREVRALEFTGFSTKY